MSIVFATERLVVREFTTEDASFIVRLLNAPGWLRHIGDRNVRSEEQGVDYLERVIFASYRINGFGFWLLERKSDGAPVGMCGVYKRDYLELPDIGYAMLPEYERQGYATEAAMETLLHAQVRLGLKSICAIVTPSNAASIRLLERIGLKYLQDIQVPPDSETLSLYSNG